jgi:hypothetical protein
VLGCRLPVVRPTLPADQSLDDGRTRVAGLSADLVSGGKLANDEAAEPAQDRQDNANAIITMETSAARNAGAPIAERAKVPLSSDIRNRPRGDMRI